MIMIKKLKSYFCPKHEEKKDFSSFFSRASVEEKRRLMEDVARKANEDQRNLIERYERTNHKAA
ncbi:MAG: hypothetical protein NT170_04155 [Candidatus Moranbacteria bacterium]|nr:hypothetical protein [Candidatus Moranbacteria bacterium]